MNLGEMGDPRLKKVLECSHFLFAFQELTGRLPEEFPLSAGETAPKIRHRVGATFKLNDIPLNGVCIKIHI